MMWIGLLAGALIGYALDGWSGAVVGGFLGWLGGLIVRAEWRAGASSVKPTARKPSFDDRVLALEIKVAALEARLDRGEMGSPTVAAAAAPGMNQPPPVGPAAPGMTQPPLVVPDAAAAAMVRDPIFAPGEIGSPTVAAAAAPGMTQPTVAAAAAPGMTQPTAAASAAPRMTKPPPSAPNPFIAWLTGGNTIARVGLLILFFGLAFLLKYAADHQMLPVELRVAGVAAGGIVLLVLGWRLREKRPGYALALQGAGVAVLYLTTFAAFRLWGLLPAQVAFVLLALIAVFSAYLAIKQDSMALAVIGAGGGFLAPILASTGAGSHVMLFGYYLLLNLGIAAVALFKAWRPLNLTGLLFTFFIGLTWGLEYYRPHYFETTEPFLIAFFLLYVAIAVLFARRQAPELKRFVDGTLVFGTPLGAFALQAGLTRGMDMALAYSSLVAAAIYVSLATILYRTRRESWALLAEAFLALGVVFVTLAIPLALDARWTSAMWALEGAAIVWVGIRQEQRIARLFGLGLQLLAGLAYAARYRSVAEGLPLLDAAFLGAVLLALAGLWSHRQLLAARERVSPFEGHLVPVLFVWGLAWWVFAGHHEIDVRLARAYEPGARVAFFAATALALGGLALRWDWRHAAIATRWLLPALALCMLVVLWDHWRFDTRHAFSGIGWASWPIAIGVQVWLLRRVLADAAPAYTGWLHAGTLWLAAMLGAVELHWLAAMHTSRGTAWSVASVVVVPALLLVMVSSRPADTRWPVANHRHAYRSFAATGIALAFIAWALYANTTHAGRSDPLPYLPLLNALDLGHILAGLAVIAVVLALRRDAAAASPLLSRTAAIIAGALAFFWMNGVLLRTLHHWADIPYTWRAMQGSVLAQASLSVFWSLLALALMVYATRAARREIWMTGAGLMAVVVAKLFLLDLSNVGGIERIVSFIAVGLLMLVIGYFSPVPPRKPEVVP